MNQGMKVRRTNATGESRSASVEKTTGPFARVMRWGAVLQTAAMIAGAGPLSAVAQAPPPAGEILRDLERSPDLRDTPLETLDDIPFEALEPPPPVVDPEADPMAAALSVVGYRIIGNEAFDDDRLLDLIADRTGELTLGEVEEAVALVTAFYRKRGYIAARAYLPQQEVTDGLVTVIVLEGVYDEIRIDNESRLSDRRVRRMMTRAICGGGDCMEEPIRKAGLERGLLLLADTPGVAPQSELQPGRTVGSAILDISAARPGLWLASLQGSNYGSRFTGEERLTLSLGLNSPLGVGDQLVVQATGSEETIYGRVRYSLPIGHRGLRFNAYGSRLEYTLGDAFEVLGASGESYTAGASLTFPLARGVNRNVNVEAAYNHHRLQDDIALQLLSNRRVLHEGVFTLSADAADRIFGGRAVTSVSASFTGGELRFNDALSAFIDAFTAQTAGAYYKANASFSRYQPIASWLGLYGRAEGQYGLENLDSFSKLALGGPGYVRAHPVGEASGDRGYFGSAELRLRPGRVLGADVELKGFYDYGVSYRNADPWLGGDNKREIKGPGAGLSINHKSGLWVSAAVAFRVGERSQSEPDEPRRIWLSGGFRL